MAAIAHAHAEQTTVQTVASTTYSDVLSITSGNFTAGKKYLLLVSAQVRVATAGSTHGIRVAHGGTAFADSEMLRIGTTSWCSYGYMTVWEAVSSEAISVQVRGASVSIAGEADQISIFAMNLSDDLTENTDWFFNERGNDDGLSTTPVDGASITFTPGGSGDWLVIAQQQVDAGDATTSTLCELNWSGATDPTAPKSSTEHANAADLWVTQLSRVYSLTAVSNTFKEIGSASSGTAHSRLHSAIFALNLNQFTDWASVWTVGDANLGTTDFGDQLATISLTPDVTSDVLIGGYWIFDGQNVSRTPEYRIQLDGSDQPGTQTTDIYQMFMKDATDERPLHLTTMAASVSTSAHTIDLDAGVSSTTSTPHAQHRSLWAFALELAAASNTTPTISPNTADAVVMSTTLPTVEFTGTDTESDDLRYQVQITDNPDAWAGGVEMEDNLSTGSGASLHPNPISSRTTWEGNPQIDDRFGQSFTGNGGILDKISIYMRRDEADTDGTFYVRVYAHQGTFGSTTANVGGHPAGTSYDRPATTALEDALLPTRGWLAKSDGLALDGTMSLSSAWYDLNFTGANRIRLYDGVKYFLVIDWVPNNSTNTNTVDLVGDSGLGHSGNAWVDGASANYGLASGWDLLFRVYESYVLLDKTSGTDSGFANTVSGGDTDPFTSGQKISYTVQSADRLSSGATYYWRARVKDPSGTDIWSSWTSTRSFTVSVGGIRPAAHHRPTFYSTRKVR